MKKILYPFSTLLPAIAIFVSSLQAQTDSSRLDLGTIRLQKEFTQYIRIKGEALERMAFTNLSEAINVWLYGVYSSTSNLSYVVDGIPVNDVGAWSIEDIEEIVLVQSALVQLNNNSGQQQLVLITTHRKHTGPVGIVVTGQTGWVDRDYRHVAGVSKTGSEVNLYHRYYVSGHYDRKNIQAGIAAAWQRDVFPLPKTDSLQVFTPAQLGRVRLNGWAGVSVGRRSRLELGLIAAGQLVQDEYTREPGPADTYHWRYRQKEWALFPSFRFYTGRVRGLQNTFSIGYQSLNGQDSAQGNEHYTANGTPNEYQTVVNDSLRTHQWVVRDNFSYVIHAHGWTIEPSVNVQYIYLKWKYHKYFASVNSPYNGISSYDGIFTENRHLFTVTPSLDVSYRHIFSIGGGAFAYLPPSGALLQKADLFPFAHCSLDLVKLFNTEGKSTLQWTGSYSRNYIYLLSSGGLSDFTAGDKVNTLPLPVGFYSDLHPNFFFNPGSLYNPQPVWQTGLHFSLPAHGLQLNYSFEKRSFTTEFRSVTYFTGGVSFNAAYCPPLYAYLHHLNIMIEPVKGSSWHWQTGITSTILYIKDIPPFLAQWSATGDTVSHHSVTGGWVNRLAYNRFSAGLDILYHVNEYQAVLNANGRVNHYNKINSFDLQNIYVGYTLHIHQHHRIDAYLNSRNLVQNSQSDVTDRRRYYGAGFKAEF